MGGLGGGHRRRWTRGQGVGGAVPFTPCEGRPRPLPSGSDPLPPRPAPRTSVPPAPSAPYAHAARRGGRRGGHGAQGGGGRLWRASPPNCGFGRGSVARRGRPTANWLAHGPSNVATRGCWRRQGGAADRGRVRGGRCGVSGSCTARPLLPTGWRISGAGGKGKPSRQPDWRRGVGRGAPPVWWRLEGSGGEGRVASIFRRTCSVCGPRWRP